MGLQNVSSGRIDAAVFLLTYAIGKIALVSQETTLFPLSVADNVRVGNPQASHDDIVRALGMAGCETFIKQLPEGIETVLTENGGKPQYVLLLDGFNEVKIDEGYSIRSLLSNEISTIKKYDNVRIITTSRETQAASIFLQ